VPLALQLHCAGWRVHPLLPDGRRMSRRPCFPTTAQAGQWAPRSPCSSRNRRLPRSSCSLVLASSAPIQGTRRATLWSATGGGGRSRARYKNVGGNRLGRCASGSASTARRPTPLLHYLLLSLVRIREVCLANREHCWRWYAEDGS
jgi:hypothetical protein